jgi:hypothetical protein
MIVAFGIGFLSFCASAIIYDMIEVHSAGALPWDRIKRPTPRRRFWTYVGVRATVAVGCGIVAVAIALMPVLAVIAVGVAPRVALKILGGGTSERGDDSGGKNPEEQSPGGGRKNNGPDA